MLIRYNSAHREGISEYLKTGRKQGRVLSRDALDERVCLLGKLALTEDLIRSIRSDGDRHLHITLGFSERDLPIETMQAVLKTYLQLLMCAYQPEEYEAYAEAHLARTKTIVNVTTGEEFERLDHIHVVIPLINLLTGRRLNPVGFGEINRIFLDAIQEHLNARYNLASPKDHARPHVNGVDIIHRSRLDNYKSGRVHRLKAELVDQIVQRNITTEEEFTSLLKSYGDIKVRNLGKETAYWAVKPAGQPRFVNLREPEFKPSFFALSATEKLQSLAAIDVPKVGVGKRSAAESERLVQTWQQTRAREVRYLNSGSKHYDVYRASTPEEQGAWLAAREAEFYARYAPPTEPVPPMPSISVGERAAVSERKIVVNPATGRESDSEFSQRLRDLNEHSKVKGAARQTEFQVIKQNLEPRRLLAELATTHGLRPHMYEVDERSGSVTGARIRHLESSVNYNVSDFLTKHMRLPWVQASAYLRDVFAKQCRMAPIPHVPLRRDPDLYEEFTAKMRAFMQLEKRRRREARERRYQERMSLRERFHIEKAEIHSDFDLHWTIRKARVSLLQMQKVQEEAALREQERRERQKEAMQQYDDLLYEDWLCEMVRRGREDALRELRQRRVEPESFDGNLITEARPTPRQIEHPLVYHHAYSFVIHRNGDVTYKVGDRNVIVDGGRAVHMLSRDDDHIELGLSLAIQKYGKEIDVHGNQQFITRAIEVAAKRRLDVSFGDPAHQAYFEMLRGESSASGSATRKTEPSFLVRLQRAFPS